MEVAGGLVTVEAMAMVVNVNDENGKRLVVVSCWWYSLPRCPRGRKMRGGLPHISPLETGY